MSRLSPVPSTPTTWSCPKSSGFRKKAMRVPSGDQAAAYEFPTVASSPGPCTNSTSRPVSTSRRYSS